MIGTHAFPNLITGSFSLPCYQYPTLMPRLLSSVNATVSQLLMEETQESSQIIPTFLPPTPIQSITKAFEFNFLNNS